MSKNTFVQHKILTGPLHRRRNARNFIIETDIRYERDPETLIMPCSIIYVYSTLLSRACCSVYYIRTICAIICAMRSKRTGNSYPTLRRRHRVNDNRDMIFFRPSPASTANNAWYPILC